MINNKFLDNFNFKKKNIYILGGSGLIGHKTSEIFLNLKAKLIILDKQPPKNFICKDKFTFFKVDIADLENINFNTIFKKFGYPDAFINTSYPRDENWKFSSFKDLTLLNLKNNVDLHMNSYAWTAKVFADAMVKKKVKGSIILLSSIYGFTGQDLNLYTNTNMHENAIYSLIKAGVINFVRQMCSYYGKYQIRVNCISPGGLYGHNAGNNSLKQHPKFLKKYCQKNPLSRLGHAEEVARLIVFITSNNASYITGANLIIDGGITSTL